MKKTKVVSRFLPVVLLAFAVTGFAASPPPVINYQGVLRNASNAPLTGTYDMTFRFYSLAVGGDEILVDAHTAGGGAPVTVTGGLFTSNLGGGLVADGTGPGSYSSLAQVFRDYGTVHLAIDVNGTVLTPRVEVRSAGYALNADNLDGLDGGQLLRKDQSDTMSGTLTANGTLVMAGSAAAPAYSFAADTNTGLYSSAADTLSIVGGGTLLVNMDSSRMLVNGGLTALNAVSAPNGSAASPAYAFFSDTNTGLFSSAADTLNFTTGGTSRVTVTSGGLSSAAALSATTFVESSLGTVSSPAFRFFPDLDTGFFSPTAGQIGFAGNGVRTMLLYPNGDLMLENRFFQKGMEIYLNNAGPDANQRIYFYEGGSFAGKYLGWDDTNADFTMNDDLLFEPTTETGRWIRNAYDLGISVDVDNDSTTAWFRVVSSGGLFEQMRINDGDEASAMFDGAVTANGIDYAEAFRVSDQTLEAGDVVVADLGAPGFIVRATVAYDSHALGVVSAKPGFLTGQSFNAEEQASPDLAAQRDEARRKGDAETEKRLSIELVALVEKQQRSVALAGRVPVKVEGTVSPGDHLTASATPGFAMPMTRAGWSIGIALEGWSNKEPGQVLAFINPGWFSPDNAQAAACPASMEPRLAKVEADLAKGLAPSRPVSQTVSGSLQILPGEDADGRTPFSVSVPSPGHEGTSAEILRVDAEGNVYAKGSFRPASLDLAEFQPVSETVEPGDVLAMDPDSDSMRRARTDADATVVGIVSSDPGILMGASLSRIAQADAALASQLELAKIRGDEVEAARLWRELEAAFRRTHAPLALSGTVPCKVDAGYGAIQRGDLLVASATPGYARRATNPAPGTVIGKALAPLKSGTGLIPVLVMLR